MFNVFLRQLLRARRRLNFVDFVIQLKRTESWRKTSITRGGIVHVESEATPIRKAEMTGTTKSDEINVPPFETEDLRRNLVIFLDSEFDDPFSGGKRRVGHFRWGVYIFYDYDGEPIYVGQTNEMLRTRIRRHLTNQRTDAVAMSVLDPFEVYEIEVYPLPQFQDVSGAADRAAARAHLNALEHAVYGKAIAGSQFKAILNEKDPPAPTVEVEIPPSFRMRVVSDDVAKIRSHPDFRIARRSLIISRLAQVISERKVQGGLRRVLLTQAKRLQWLADRRYHALGGSLSVEAENVEEDDND